MMETPDHTVWYSHSPNFDKCIRAADYETFAKIDLFELGANIRRLRDKVKGDAALLPKPGTEFASEHFLEHVHLLSYLGPWLEALGFDLQGRPDFSKLFTNFGSSVNMGSTSRHVLGICIRCACGSSILQFLRFFMAALNLSG